MCATIPAGRAAGLRLRSPVLAGPLSARGGATRASPAPCSHSWSLFWCWYTAAHGTSVLERKQTHTRRWDWNRSYLLPHHRQWWGCCAGAPMGHALNLFWIKVCLQMLTTPCVCIFTTRHSRIVCSLNTQKPPVTSRSLILGSLGL